MSFTFDRPIEYMVNDAVNFNLTPKEDAVRCQCIAKIKTNKTQTKQLEMTQRIFNFNQISTVIIMTAQGLAIVYLDETEYFLFGKLFKGIKEKRWNIDASIVNILPSPDKKTICFLASYEIKTYGGASV